MTRYKSQIFGSKNRLNSESVELQSDSPCEVELTSGEICPCDYIACTLPIGGLKGLSDESRVQLHPFTIRQQAEIDIKSFCGSALKKIFLLFFHRMYFGRLILPRPTFSILAFNFLNCAAYTKPGIPLAHIFGTSLF